MCSEIKLASLGRRFSKRDGDDSHIGLCKEKQNLQTTKKIPRKSADVNHEPT